MSNMGKMEELYKIVKPKATGMRDLSLTIMNQEGHKFVITVTDLNPYCFVSRDNISEINHLLTDKMKDEHFTDLNENKMMTIIMDHPAQVGQFRKKVHEENKGIIFQADVKYELSCLVRLGTLRYLLVDTPDVLRGKVSANNIIRPPKEQIASAKFPKFVKKFIDTEFDGNDKTLNIDDVIAGFATCICVVVDTNLYILTDEQYDNFTHTLYSKEMNVNCFNDEKKLITAVYNDLNKGHIAIAWHSEFDEMALKNRSKQLGLYLNWDTVQWLDIQKSFIANLGISSQFISLKDAFDIVFYYNRDNWKRLPELFQEYYTLDEFYMPQLNTDSKIYKYLKWRKTVKARDVHDLYANKEIKKLMFYNASDVLDMIALDIVSGVDGYIAQFDVLGVTRIEHVFVHSWKIEPTPLQMAMLNNIASPSMDKTRPKQQGLEGGLVHDAILGEIHEDVVVTDFSRFYISIILSKLVSPENPPKMKDNEGDDIWVYAEPQGPSRKPPKRLINILPDGTKLRNPMFFLEALAYYLIRTREEAEISFINAETEEEEAYYENLKDSFKTLTSGLWGYISHSTGRYYASHVASQILQEARNFNMILKDHVDNTDINCYDGNKPLRFKTIYGDTDSAFFKPLKKIDLKKLNVDAMNDHLNKFLKEVCDSRGYVVSVSVKVEKLLSKMNMLGKKNYYDLTVWKENVGWLEEAEFEMKGVAAKKQNFSSFSKDFQFAIMNFHLRYGMQGIRKVVQQYRKEFKKGIATLRSRKINKSFLESIAKPVSFKQSFAFYKYKTKEDEKNDIITKSTAFTYYTLAAEEWNKYIDKGDEDNIIKEGSKAFCFPIKTARLPNMNLNSYLVFTNANLVDWSKVKLDLLTIEDMNLKDKINKILANSGFKKDEIEALMMGRANPDISDLI